MGFLSVCALCMHGPAAMGRWTEITAYYNCTRSTPSGRWLTAACRYGKWVEARMKRHWQDMHQTVASFQPHGGNVSSTSSQAPMQSDSSASTLRITGSANNDCQGSKATGFAIFHRRLGESVVSSWQRFSPSQTSTPHQQPRPGAVREVERCATLCGSNVTLLAIALFISPPPPHGGLERGYREDNLPWLGTEQSPIRTQRGPAGRSHHQSL